MMEIFIFYISKKILKLNAIHNFIKMKKKCYNFLGLCNSWYNKILK